jgi:hypothetical protein
MLGTAERRIAASNTPHVSLRDAILWVAYGEGKSADDLSGDGLWLNREKQVVDARTALWSALESGSLEASALDDKGTPVVIGKHEWRFLLGRCASRLAWKQIGEDASYVKQIGEDALYVKGSRGLALSIRGGLAAPRFTSVAIPRDRLLYIWPPRVQVTAASGRPSIMNQLEAELDRWIEGGFPLLSSQMKQHGQANKETIIAIARALEHWSIKNGLKAGADDEPRAKGIENALRSKLRKAVELL